VELLGLIATAVGCPVTAIVPSGLAQLERVSLPPNRLTVSRNVTVPSEGPPTSPRACVPACANTANLPSEETATSTGSAGPASGAPIDGAVPAVTWVRAGCTSPPQLPLAAPPYELAVGSGFSVGVGLLGGGREIGESDQYPRPPTWSIDVYRRR
jgi:hypothetical protein